MKKLLPIITAAIVAGVFLYIQSSDQRMINDQKGDAYDLVIQEKGVKQYDRPDLAIQQNLDMTEDPKLGYPPVHRMVEAFESLKARYALDQAAVADLSASTQWVERGPNNIGGRTRALMFDPNDSESKRVWAGGIGGGIWYIDDITDPSLSWNNVDDFLANLAVSDLEYDPSNTNTFYASTGLGYTNDIQGAGIFKSTDAGSTWTQLSSTDIEDFYFVQNIEVDASGQVYASTLDGVMISTDGGSSWTNVLSGRAGDLEISSDGTVYATLGVGSAGSIHRSTDDGANWTDISPETNGTRIEITSAPSDADVLYAVADGAAGTADVQWFYKSEDAGDTWEEITIPIYLEQDCTFGNSHFTRGQAFFDLILAVHPEKPDRVIAGGIDLHLSTDGGLSWNPISYWTGGFCDAYVHADQHAIEFRPGYPDEAIFGSDGGVSYSNDIGTATNPNFETRVRGYNVTTFYAVTAANEANSNYFLAGAQDNGSLQFTNPFLNDTREVTGGDGAFCFIDQDNSDIQITSFIFNSYRLSQDGGLSFTSISDDQNRGRFINPSDYDSDADILYGAGNTDELTRITGISGTVNTQEVISVDLSGRQITTIKVSPHTANRLFVGVRISGGEGLLFIIDDADEATPTVTEITGTYSGSHGGWVSSIDVGATDDDLMATFSNYGVNSVYTSSDGGANWANKEGDLPDMPVRWGVFNPLDRTQVLIATELGVWSTNDITAGSPDWEPTNMGLANVRTDMIKVRPTDNVVVAATYGRGVFTSDVIVENADADFEAPQVGYVGVPVQFNDASLQPNSSWNWNFGDASSSTAQNPSHTYSTAGTYTVSLGVDSNSDVETKTDFITILPAYTPPYTPAMGGDFESNQSDFTSQELFGGINKWELGTPANDLSTAPSGTNVWKTDLDADVTNPGHDYGSALYSPAFDLSTAGNYSLKFTMEMASAFCNAPYGLQVQYSIDGGVEWTTLGSSYSAFGVSNWYNRGDNTGCSLQQSIFPEKVGWLLTTDGELMVEHTLNALVGESNVSFRLAFVQVDGFSAESYQEDGVLIDDFEVTYEGPTADFSVESNIGFVGADIEFTYQSNGATSYSWDFGDGGSSTEENPTHSFADPGTYDVTLSITSSMGSDMVTNSILILPSLTIPYLTADGGDLETNQDHFAADNISGTGFELGNSSISGKDGTNSGSNAWVTGINDSQYVDDSEAYLYTPVFDFLNLGNYSLSFFANFSFEDNWDGFIVQYSTDRGQSWEKLNPVEEEGWYNQTSDPQSVFGASVPIFSGNTDGFEEFGTDLTFLAGTEFVALRFQFLTDAATVDVGMALDDITVDGPEPGPGVPAFSLENVTGCEGQVVTFVNESTGSISNFAWDFGANATPATASGPGPHEVTYSGTGTSTVSLTITSPVNGITNETKVDVIETSALHSPTFTSTFNASAGTYTLEASSGDSYQWLADGEVLSGETSRTLTVDLGDGREFSVVVTIGSCEVEAEGQIINSVLDERFTIYPNPSRGMLNIDLESQLQNASYAIYNTGGQLMEVGQLTNSSSTLNLTTYNEGLYIVHLNLNGVIKKQQIVLMK